MDFVSIPQWFRINNVIIDAVSFVVLIIFFFLCFNYYRLTKKKNFLYLGIGFVLISLAQLAEIALKLGVYYDVSFIQQVGQAIVTYHILTSVKTFYIVASFFNKLLTLAGFYIIYRLITKKSSSGEFILAIYFIVISVVASTTADYLFHLTIVLLLLLIMFGYYETYKRTRVSNTAYLILAFSLLAIAHFIALVTNLATPSIIANLIELASYLILLVLIIKIIRKG